MEQVKTSVSCHVSKASGLPNSICLGPFSRMEPQSLGCHPQAVLEALGNSQNEKQEIQLGKRYRTRIMLDKQPKEAEMLE